MSLGRGGSIWVCYERICVQARKTDHLVAIAATQFGGLSGALASCCSAVAGSIYLGGSGRECGRSGLVSFPLPSALKSGATFPFATSQTPIETALKRTSKFLPKHTFDDSECISVSLRCRRCNLNID